MVVLYVLSYFIIVTYNKYVKSSSYLSLQPWEPFYRWEHHLLDFHHVVECSSHILPMLSLCRTGTERTRPSGKKIHVQSNDFNGAHPVCYLGIIWQERLQPFDSQRGKHIVCPSVRPANNSKTTGGIQFKLGI